jgi:hypothetical protein
MCPANTGQDAGGAEFRDDILLFAHTDKLHLRQ